MSQKNVKKAGRKRVSSRAMLEEAACELFLENTYAGTTIEQITQRAGVSRNTFFNYFGVKSDVLWSSVDEAVDEFADEVQSAAADTDAVHAVRAALIAASARFGPARLPLAVTQFDVMGTQDELRASGLARFLAMADVVERFLLSRSDLHPPGRARVIAFALVGAVAAAADEWAGAGTARHPLSDYVTDAITPIALGYAQPAP